MKQKLFFTLQAALILLVMTLASSCADSKTEQKLDGTWQCVQYEKEDGMKMKMTETITYNASDHTFNSKIAMRIVSPVSVNVGTIKYSGTWSATSSKVIGEIDRNSLDFNFNSDLDASTLREMKEEFKSTLEEGDYVDGGKILSITTNEFRLRDEEDGTIYEYTRQR